jgi:hypothetical protein
MLSEAEKSKIEKKYAFNIDLKRSAGLVEKTLNFEKMNRGFYDDLIETDDLLKQKKNNLTKTKNFSIKESIYSNRRIPQSWRNKISYYNELYKTMSKDKYFVSYLGKGGENINAYSTMTQTQPNLTTDLSIKNSDKNKFLNTISVKSPSNEKDNNLITKNMFYNANNKSSGAYAKLYNQIAENRKIHNILEEFKTNFPLTLPTIPKLTTNETDKNENKLLITQTNDKKETTSNLTTEEKEEKKSNLSDSKTKPKPVYRRRKKGELTKAEVFKSTLYNNLLPPGDYVNEETKKELKKKKKQFSLENFNENKYLFSSAEAFNKKITITNPKIEEKLQDINYWGPHYSHCPPCFYKNMYFYENMEKNQCYKLLNYLKKVRIKSNSDMETKTSYENTEN